MLSQRQTFSKKAIKSILKDLDFEKIHKKYRRKIVKTNLVDFVFEVIAEDYHISLEKETSSILLISTDNFEEYLSYIFQFYDILNENNEKTND
jgi:hypothetical protein